MSNIAIKVEDLSKQYRIGAKQEGYRTLRDTVTHALVSPFRRAQKLLRGQAYGAAELDETIWALKGVSCEIKRGEVVGIIGSNGAGKTTLLKILSRITEPTEGYAEIHGRVGSLLEVGTGFHPELTGRENVYLNGAILGMKKAEIERKFDEMVDFAEIEKFIDTPVKHYSSGMYVRLAFAVAAHLEPEILLVDEVLAVGDAAFQRKCLGKIGNVAKEGRTILFVSHNMVAVRNLCNRVIWLDKGTVHQSGASDEVSYAYLRESVKVESVKDARSFIASLPPDEIVQLEAVDIRQDGETRELMKNGKPVEVEIRYRVLRRVHGLRVYFDILDEEGNILVRTYHDDEAELEEVMVPGRYCSVATIPANLLAPHRYIIRVCATIESSLEDYHCCVPGGVSIPVQFQWTSKINHSRPGARIISKIQPLIGWRTQSIAITAEHEDAYSRPCGEPKRLGG
ncbi:MAG: polysaccharide ABC transporter ATP-binding protein [Deltaproteobacteria bacterium]|nr:polysaccharide ABC transporter ATP-binding protein [Deltaproteobacteria bacterium]MDH3876638.1 polysaccharide ABC transporter ATP-binding protein [Desulfobacterales bacterium]MDH3964526.1 polysaccharide ABC transporter ATP-binding protein [Deltaproteobacteria bacterium]